MIFKIRTKWWPMGDHENDIHYILYITGNTAHLGVRN